MWLNLGEQREAWQEMRMGTQVRSHHRAYGAQEGILMLVFLQWKPPEYFKHSHREI